MKPTALITGASKGIGAELARTFASKNNNLILVARSEKELNDLKQELENKFDISVKVIAKDLTKSENVRAVYDEIKAFGMEVDYLVNNAGRRARQRRKSLWRGRAAKGRTVIGHTRALVCGAVWRCPFWVKALKIIWAGS